MNGFENVIAEKYDLDLETTRDFLTRMKLAEVLSPRRSVSDIHRVLYAYFETVKTCLISNYGEFAINKIWIIHFIPDTDKLRCVTVA